MKNISEAGVDGVWAAELEAAPSWREFALRLEPLAALSPGPQGGTGASSAGKARCTTGGGSQIAWESDGEESNPAKTEATHRAAIPTISQLHPSTTLCLFRNCVWNLLSMVWVSRQIGPGSPQHSTHLHPVDEKKQEGNPQWRLPSYHEPIPLDLMAPGSRTCGRPTTLNQSIWPLTALPRAGKSQRSPGQRF